MSMNNIEHVVLLMLENRSFDSMLGWLYEKDAPALNIPEASAGDRFRGLQSMDLAAFTNSAMDGRISSPPVRGSSGPTVPGISPGEEFEHVNMQFFEKDEVGGQERATMKGVLKDYVRVLKGDKYSDADILRRAGMIMDTHTPNQLPVLNQLARHYAVSDGWFASVPSQTNPNRAFTLCGSSHGLASNGFLEQDRRAREIEKILGMGIGDDRFPDDTIFNAIDEIGGDWQVFWETSLIPEKLSKLLRIAGDIGPLVKLLGPLGLLLGILLDRLKPFSGYLQELSSGQLDSCYTYRLFPRIREKIQNAAQHFSKVEEFHKLARGGKLPKFSFIEPFWTISKTAVGSGLEKLVTQMGNDYHPPANLIVGENYVKQIYESLIANPETWRKTLLIITFDEFVGSFDHVSPPAATPPWGKDGKPDFPLQNNFNFDRFGARVPAILVSPYVQKGTVFRASGDVPYDHTSIIATTLKWLGDEKRVAGFGARAALAPTFENVLTLDQPRTDERALDFLHITRNMGDPVKYGDLFFLRNQHGKYLSAFKHGWKTAAEDILPNASKDIGSDLNLAAFFPTLGNSEKAALFFLNHEPDRPSEVKNNDRLWVVSSEAGLGAYDFLGAWADSHDCYYYNTYLEGKDEEKQIWTVQKVNKVDGPLRYGDQIYLVNQFYKDQRLTRDTRLLQGEWIATAKGGDYWTIEPVPR